MLVLAVLRSGQIRGQELWELVVTIMGPVLGLYDRWVMRNFSMLMFPWLKETSK